MNKTLLRIAGGITVLFGIFHVVFPQIFNWQEALAPLSQDDRSIMYIFNYTTAAVIFGYAFITLGYTKSLLTTSIGRGVTGMMAVFWGWRIVLEVIYEGFTVGALPVSALCLIVVLGYAIPLINTRGETIAAAA
jgi:hypothetical protein